MCKSDALIDENFEIVRFSDLPDPHKRAVIWYMARDGDAWEPLIPMSCKEAAYMSAKVIRAYDRLYGDEVIGIGSVSTEKLVASVVTDDVAGEEFTSHQAIIDLEILQHPIQPPEERYPVIFNDSENQTIQDGWTRFATYVYHRYEQIPALFFVKEHHHGLLAERKAVAALIETGPRA